MVTGEKRKLLNGTTRHVLGIFREAVCSTFRLYVTLRIGCTDLTNFFKTMKLFVSIATDKSHKHIVMYTSSVLRLYGSPIYLGSHKYLKMYSVVKA